jgi:PAS domain S-box-containing protein
MKIIDKSLTNTTPAKMAQILIVEDEYIIAANLQENLESLGYSVLDIESSAEDAVKKAISLRPDLVLMDIRLQGAMDGIQAAEQIWNCLQIPVIYVTGHSDTNTLERAKVTFPFGYILKPVKAKELYVAIETALSRYEREQFLSNVLQRIGDGVVVVDTQSRIKYLNRAAEILTGWQQHEAKDQDLVTVLNLVDEETRQPIGNPTKMGVQQDSLVCLNKRVLLVTKNGSAIPITDSVASLIDNQGKVTGAVLVFRDDTQRRLQEEHNLTLQRAQILERQKEELQRLNQLKDDFLSMVSHELRTPLSNIKMAIRMLEIALDQKENLDAEGNLISSRMNRYMDILRDQCNQELILVNDLLELQQIEAGGLPLEWVSIHLNQWMLNGIEIFQERAQHREQCLQASVPSDLPLLISDLAILTRIFTELLMNACKYTPPGGEIIVSAHAQSENYIQLVVCNTGVEIPADELSRVFDKFYRIPTSDRYRQGGTGLGLALVKKQVACLGGSIRVESSAGQTRFIVELPVTPPDYDH